MSRKNSTTYTHEITCDWCGAGDKTQDACSTPWWIGWHKITSLPWNHGVQYASYADVCPDCAEAYFKFVGSRKPTTNVFDEVWVIKNAKGEYWARDERWRPGLFDAKVFADVEPKSMRVDPRVITDSSIVDGARWVKRVDEEKRR